MDFYTDAAPANHVIEVRFQSKHVYQEPFSDISLDVLFTDPSEEQHTVPAFWVGQNNWAVRYSSAIVGKHQFTSICNDVSNKDLHQIKGEIEVTTYAGDNCLLRHGAPSIASDKRHFSYADGTPFFWLGDTWWLGLTNRLSWPHDFKVLAKDRQQKGFTIVQIVAGLYPDMAAFDTRGESNAGFAWLHDFTAINPAFFDEADARIIHLVSLGISPCILGCWGYYLQWLGTEKMKLHWRYIMARWGALPVVWTAAGEQIMPWYLSTQKKIDSVWLKHKWTEIIRYMHEINTFDRIITTHPQSSARKCVEDPLLLDFEMQQTNHHSPTARQAARAVEGWYTKPIMPVMNGESRYEALEIIPKVTTADTRQAFWAHMLNSGCAGHTYGVNGVWQVNLTNKPFGKSPNGHNWGNTPWNRAMNLAGSTQLSLAKKLLLSLPWHQLQPIKPGKVTKWQKAKWQKFAKLISIFKWRQQPIAAAKTPDNTLAIYYTLSLKSFLINMPHPSNVDTNAFWFDPTSGNITNAPSSKNRDNQFNFTPPSYNSTNEKDWLLVITTKNTRM